MARPCRLQNSSGKLMPQDVFSSSCVGCWVQGRIPSRSNLLKKHVAICEVCQQAEETADHVILGCPFACEFWDKIGLPLPSLSSGAISNIHGVQCPHNIPRKHFAIFIALCCRQLRKRRNGVVFRSEMAGHRQMLASCVSDAVLWKLTS